MKNFKINRKILYSALYILHFTFYISLTGCTDWLDVRPKDLQYTADFWQSKEDVQAVLAAGYSDMRNLTQKLIVFGELRSASMVSNYIKPEEIPLQDFQMDAGAGLCSWGDFYKVINMANSVLKYAPEVRNIDETYSRGAMLSHEVEAYFMRSLMYFYLVRNWREAPLVLDPYIDDSAPFEIAKSGEADIIAQIKADIRAALNTGAAKERYEGELWQNKGRVTKWALYALMADVCLWNEEYDDCIAYSDSLIFANAAWRPVFMTNADQWFEIFEYGNSNESIFEINWSATLTQTSGSPFGLFPLAATANRRFAPAMTQRLMDENAATTDAENAARVRSYYTYLYDAGLGTDGALVYKYVGSVTKPSQRAAASANFIVYRMADIMLLKAEALAWKGGADNWRQTLEIVNQIRVRTNLDSINVDMGTASELDIINTVLHERDMELAAEGKRWYDLVRFGKAKEFKYKQEFIDIIVENNSTANKNWLRSALKNDWAWFMPVSHDELEVNRLLTQNPYYGR